jgi:ribonuclease HII
MKCEWLIGIDEVGRGPLAGPVAVGVVLVPSDFDWGLIKGVNDSKKITEKKREVIFEMAKILKKQQSLDYEVAMVSAKTIDEIGIVPAIKKALVKSLEKIETRNSLTNKDTVAVKLDGGLSAPEAYKYQETIIKGDSKELVIGLASIVAKVTRDKYMSDLHLEKEFQSYNFINNKGYGTKNHLEQISLCGFSVEHRRSFCRNISLK